MSDDVQDIVISEGDAPLLMFKGKRKDEAGAITPYLIEVGDDITFDAKVHRDDAAALFSYTRDAGEIVVLEDGTSPGAEHSLMSVQTSAVHTATPQTLWYRLRVIRDNRPDTVRKGWLVIENA